MSPPPAAATKESLRVRRIGWRTARRPRRRWYRGSPARWLGACPMTVGIRLRRGLRKARGGPGVRIPVPPPASRSFASIDPLMAQQEGRRGGHDFSSGGIRRSGLRRVSRPPIRHEQRRARSKSRVREGHRPDRASPGLPTVCARDITRGASTTNRLAVVGSVGGGSGGQAMDAAEPRRGSRSAHLVRRGLRTLLLVGPVRD